MKTLKFCYPNLTRAVSVTGTRCALSCAHCGGHYLRFMETPDEVRERGARHYRSALISGGMNLEGWVPVEFFTDFFELLKSWKWRLNFHVGLLPSGLVPVIKDVADRVSFDFLSDARTIREVYGLKATGADYHDEYKMLSKDLKVVPHITLGLLGGRIYGEKEALDSLRSFNPGEIVFLVFKPTVDTRFKEREPPPLADVESIFDYARELFPGSTFSLGCMRPRGSYGIGLERLALIYGFDKYVLPSNPFKEMIGKEDFHIEEYQECCAL